MARTFKRIDPLQEHKEKVKEVVKVLPEGWRKDFYNRNKAYDTRAGSKLLENVVAGRSSDIGILYAMQNLHKWYARKEKKTAKGERHD